MTPCAKLNHLGGPNCRTCIEHEILRGFGERRRMHGIRLRKLEFFAEKTQVEAFHILFQELIRRYGKEGAVDSMLAAMAENEARIWQAEQLLRERRKAKRSKK